MMNPTKITLWPQWFTGFTTCLAVLTAGLSNGWTSPYLAQLTSPYTNTPLKLTDEEASWVASLLPLGRFGGAICGAISQGIIGRRKTLIIAILPTVIGWACTIMLKTVTWLYIARFACGVGVAMLWTTLSLFLGEIADPSIRGSLIFLNTNAASVGALIGTAIGPYIPMDQFGYVGLTISILYIVLIYFIPESPYHHVLNGNMKRAELSLKWFKREADVAKEIQELKDFVGNSLNVTFSIRLKELMKSKNLRKIMMMLMLNIFVYVGGHNTMNYYAEIIVIKSAVSVTPSTVVTSLCLCTVIAGATATIFVDKFGRRTLLIASSLGTSLALILLGSHFHLLSIGFEAASLTWLPIFALFLFNFSITCGLIPVPNALVSELFPPMLKTIASMFFSGSSALIAFMVSKTFQSLVNIMDEKYVFWMFALGAFCATPYTYLFIPETTAKTLIEIQKNIELQKEDKNTIDNDK
ncbi:hypothetical protein PV325_012350 [Microctonus aethiopoides]|uniref:Major facilitator superfamily (MFS) profile domain-containing protein n=1 Tax=Microctonus aethiopoides TaxID=144406 RepID=A0AA39FQI4_9HYME|nr:hypothetical protein PV325_012350 [Microctonus aethiopoides]KAK0097037.1 hypothetical protein PV326_003527 [Microctonus aethiopoides]KAK0173838.1 hypothetical protein PV328_006981 [Microctonus aethiopoides]